MVSLSNYISLLKRKSFGSDVKPQDTGGPVFVRDNLHTKEPHVMHKGRTLHRKYYYYYCYCFSSVLNCSDFNILLLRSSLQAQGEQFILILNLTLPFYIVYAFFYNFYSHYHYAHRQSTCNFLFLSDDGYRFQQSETLLFKNIVLTDKSNPIIFLCNNVNPSFSARKDCIFC